MRFHFALDQNLGHFEGFGLWAKTLRGLLLLSRKIVLGGKFVYIFMYEFDLNLDVTQHRRHR